MSNGRRLLPPTHPEHFQEDFPLFRFMENFRRGVELYNLSQIKKNNTISTIKNFDHSSCENTNSSNIEK